MKSARLFIIKDRDRKRRRLATVLLLPIFLFQLTANVGVNLLLVSYLRRMQELVITVASLHDLQ